MQASARPTLRLLLIDTSTAGVNGSMARYARLVEQALAEQVCLAVRFEVKTLCLSLPGPVQGWLPSGIRVWVNHVWILLTSRIRVAREPHDIIHMVDGSYAYCVNGVAAGCPILATVHDLIPLLQLTQESAGGTPSLPARWIVKKSLKALRRCRHLVADSECTRNDLVRLVGIAKDDITVVQIALDSSWVKFGTGPGADPSPATVDLKPTVFHVGHNGHYKNRAGVIRVFARIRAQTAARLVMAGPPPTAALRDLVKAQQVEGDVVFVENPDDAQLFRLYQDAAVFLFPSIYEGFGWPPLEAMALGCPVVCSTAASLPEVVGDAALSAPVGDEDELARLCLAVLNDRNLADSLITKGRERASEFTVERMGEQLVEVYRRVMEGRRRPLAAD